MNVAAPNRRESGSLALGVEQAPSRDLWRAVIVAAAALSIDQAYYVVESHLPTYPALIGSLLVPLGVFGLVPLLGWWEGRPWRDYGLRLRGPVFLPLAYSAVFTLIFLIVQLEPGFIFGFGRALPVSSLTFGFLLFYGPLVALSQCSVFLGVLFRRLTGRLSLTRSMLVTSAFFAVAATNIAVFPLLGANAAVQLLFTTTLTTFVLGMVLALYFYKDQWSLLGPISLQASLVLVTYLLPISAILPSWQDSFVAALTAYAAILVAVAVLLKEPRIQAKKYLGTEIGPRRYRFRDRARSWRAARATALAFAAVAAVVVISTVALPAAAGTPSTPILAIATGSMVPTFERGTLILLEKATPDQIHVGTIIAFHVSCLPAPTVHRVYKILVAGPSPVYLTKGDHNPSPDPCDVPYSHVIGRAVVWVPYLGYLILDPLFAAALIVLAVVSVALIREPRT
jgi:signal peptidase I